MIAAGKLSRRNWLLTSPAMLTSAAAVVSAISIEGPRDGVHFSWAAPGPDSTSTTTARPKPPVPESSRQVRRAAARAAAKVRA